MDGEGAGFDEGGSYLDTSDLPSYLGNLMLVRGRWESSLGTLVVLRSE